MRKTSEIKAMAKERMYPRLSSLVGAVLIFGGIFIGLAFIIAIIYTSQLISQGVFASEEALLEYMQSIYDVNSSGSVLDTIISYAFEIILGALLATLSTGFMFVCLKAARNEDFKASDIFAVYKMNPDRIICIYLIGFVIKFICTLPSYAIDRFMPVEEGLSIAGLLSFVIGILSYVLQLIVTVLLSQAYFIYIDNPDQNSILTVKSSFEMMKNKALFGPYLLLVISFIPWYIVVACTFGFALLWVLPFINIAYALFYMNAKGELGSRIDTLV